jgi:hypothetical protein
MMLCILPSVIAESTGTAGVAVGVTNSLPDGGEVHPAKNMVATSANAIISVGNT